MSAKRQRWVMTAILVAGLGTFAWEVAAWAATETDIQQAEAAYGKADYAKAADLYRKALGDPTLDRTLVGSIRSKIALCEVALSGKLVAMTGPAATSPATAPAGLAAGATSGTGAGAVNPTAIAPMFAMDAATRQVHAKPKAGEVRAMEIQQLGNFEYDPDVGGHIPDDVKALDGMKISLRGYMIPLTQAEDKVSEFALVPSLFGCCFGAPPQVQHTIMVHCPAKQPALYSADAITVEGTLKVFEKREDAYTVSIFEVSGASVKPTPDDTIR